MVEEVDAHEVAGFFHPFRDAVVLLAGLWVVAGVIVCDGDDRGVVDDGEFDDQSHVDGGLADATHGESLRLDELVVLVHQQHPGLFHVEVLHLGMEVEIDAVGGVDA